VVCKHALEGGFLSALRDELHHLVESLPEEELAQVRDFVKVLLQEAEELTEEEWQEVREGEEEFKRGTWVIWKDVRRKDVRWDVF
jgi:hypothetical protein